MTAIPMSIIEYINDNSKYPAGVIGCRAAEGNVSYSCCEYDVAVFCDKNRPDLDKVINLFRFSKLVKPTTSILEI